MANVVKALAVVVKIAPVGVRVLALAATKMDVGMAPCTEGAPIDHRTSVEDQQNDSRTMPA